MFSEESKEMFNWSSRLKSRKSDQSHREEDEGSSLSGGLEKRFSMSETLGCGGGDGGDGRERVSIDENPRG